MVQTLDFSIRETKMDPNGPFWSIFSILVHLGPPTILWPFLMGVCKFGDEFGESLGGSQAPTNFWKVPGLPRTSANFPRSSLATSPEVLSLWNLTAMQRFPGSFPDFPGGQPMSLGSLTPSPDSQKLPLKSVGLHCYCNWVLFRPTFRVKS